MRVPIKPGQKARTVGCYSEVMMHMGLAGRPVDVELLQHVYQDGHVHHYAQVYRDGQPAGGAVTTGEAGIYTDGWEFTIDQDESEGDADPKQVQEDMTRMLREALSGPHVTVITNLGLG
jgi:hypothetical protein